MPGSRRLAQLCLVLVSLWIAMIMTVGHVLAGEIRDTIEDRGYLKCGIEETTPFFSKINPLENAAREFCQAITIALFHDKNAFKIISIPHGRNTDFLVSNSVDLVMLAGINNFEKSHKTVLSAPLLVNGFALLNLKGDSDPKKLNGKRICTLNNKQNNVNLAVFGQKHQISFSVLSYKTPEQLRKAASRQECGAIALSRINLLQFKLKILSNFPLAQVINSTSGSPKLGILVSSRDQEWINITSWFGHALIEAEIENITSTNIDLIASASIDPTVQVLLGLKGNLGLTLGLDKQWAYRVIKSHGNYREIYQRHFGEKSSFPIKRDPIALLLGETTHKKSYSDFN